MPVTATDIARATKTDRKLFELNESLKSGTELPVPWKVSDAYSKWIEVIPMKNIAASFTIHHLRILFAHYGIPLTLVSDNGATFTSYEFRHFLKLNNIKHITSAPYHPATNGQAERIVQLFKASLKSSRDQIRKCGKSIELSQAATEIPIYDKELNFPDEPVSDDVAESEPPAPVPEVVPKPKDVPVPATPSDDIPPKPVPDASGKPKTDVPLRRSNRIRRPPKRLDL
ncbi:uncharacterized protein TNCV_5046781 [Trichonephila clavipes]|nr:uncharacterized protein TNCV_5046781 [Trichonephila clavipes]